MIPLQIVHHLFPTFCQDSGLPPVADCAPEPEPEPGNEAPAPRERDRAGQSQEERGLGFPSVISLPGHQSTWRNGDDMDQRDHGKLP